MDLICSGSADDIGKMFLLIVGKEEVSRFSGY